MTFLLWQSHGAARIASPRLVLRASEVAPLQHAQELCERLAQLHHDEQQRIAAAAAEARAQGRAQGVDEGRRAASAEVAATLLACAQASERVREQTRREMAALALQVVRKMLGRFADDDVLAALAETAAAEALPAQQLAVVVHPEMCDAVRERLAARTAHDAAAPRFDVRADAACARDTCRLETEHGSIDASLDEQLARLEKAWASLGPDDEEART
jgi:flagellar biosynthesis/type III secretory pathway protein FliH